VVNTVRHNQFGKDACLLSEVVVTGRKVGAGNHFYAQLAHDEEGFRKTLHFVERGFRSFEHHFPFETYQTTVDYSGILRKGESWIGSGFMGVPGNSGMPDTEIYCATGIHTIGVHIVTFDVDTYYEMLCRELALMNMRPAILVELLWLARQHPTVWNREEESRILAIGTIHPGREYRVAEIHQGVLNGAPHPYISSAGHCRQDDEYGRRYKSGLRVAAVSVE